MSEFLIYGLSCPTTGEIRYVGKTIRGKERAKAHLRPSSARRDGNTHKRAWLNKLQREGREPKVLVLETCANEAALNEAECWNIQYYCSLGNRLTNLTYGGDGMSGWVPDTKTRAKWSAALKGVSRSQEVKRKISDAQKGKPKKESAKRAMSVTKSRTCNTPEGRRLMSLRSSRKVTDQYGNIYDSVTAAAIAAGVHRVSVTNNLRANLSGITTIIQKCELGFAYVQEN